MELEQIEARATKPRRVILGEGAHVVNYGTWEGSPAVFIEPAPSPGPVGGDATGAGLPKDVVSPAGLVLTLLNPLAALTLIEAITKALLPRKPA